LFSGNNTHMQAENQKDSRIFGRQLINVSRSSGGGVLGDCMVGFATTSGG
jgi:hypothetical protein